VSKEWTLHKSSSIPLHQQIYDFIKNRIMNGEWPVGTKLPTQRSLSEKFQVNRSTIVYALGELTADGLIESRVGKGTFVINNTWSVLTSTPPPDWKSYVKAGSYQPNIQTIQEINKAEANPTMIRLGTGELSPELLPNEELKQMLRGDSIAFSLGYSEPKGSLYLREQISDYMKSKGINVSPSSILIVSGALQALQLISLGLLKRNSTMFLEAPSYLNSVHVFQSAGIDMFGLPMDAEGIQTETIGKLKRQHNGALLYTIPNFHNPTGTLMTLPRRQALLNVCHAERLPIIEDDVYGDLWFDTPPPPSLKALDTQGNVLYLGSMSKTFGPGLRIGWVMGPEPVIDRLSDIKMQTDYGSSTLSQYAVAQSLSTGFYEEHVKKIRTKLKFRRDFTMDLLNQYFKQHATWNTPSGGFYIWLSIHKPLSLSLLFEKALKRGILLNPGNVYHRHDQHHLRLSYAYAPLDQLEKGLFQLARIIDEWS
jgi:GntR family transcriptional regulator, regulator for abcA and norABC